MSGPKAKQADLPAVPWIVPWTGENDHSIRPCRWAGGEVALSQPHRPGIGKPMWRAVHSVRRRRAFAEGLCEICGKPVTSDDRWVFPPTTTGTRSPTGAAIIDAPMHGECARHSASTCPHLRERRREPAPLPLGMSLERTLIYAGPNRIAEGFGVNIAPRPYVLLWGTYTMTDRQLAALFGS